MPKKMTNEETWAAFSGGMSRGMKRFADAAAEDLRSDAVELGKAAASVAFGCAALPILLYILFSISLVTPGLSPTGE